MAEVQFSERAASSLSSESRQNGGDEGSDIHGVLRRSMLRSHFLGIDWICKEPLRLFSLTSCVNFLWWPNKLTQTVWLKTTEIYAPTVLEAGHPKSWCQQCWFLLEALREKPLHASLPACSGFRGPLHPVACPRITPASALHMASLLSLLFPLLS